jgi:predicted phosphodiesterase
MRATPSGASIFWETPGAAGCVRATLDGSGPPVTGTATHTTVTHSYGVDIGLKQPDLAGDYDVARIDVTGLAPGSCHTYATSGGGQGRFCTARASGDAFKFLAIGDTNPVLGHTVPILNHVLPEQPDFTVHMGDIQYYESVAETQAYWFGAMAPLLRAGAFYPTIGNHENELNGTEFADYYDRLFHQPSLDGTPPWFRFSSGGVWFHAIDTEIDWGPGSDQFKWLSQSFADAAASPGFRFSVLYMHRNLYTLGDAAPEIDQRNALAPLFAMYKVRLVLSGHMHGYERFEVGDITYITTGGGGGTINNVNGNVATYPDEVPLRVAVAPAYEAVVFEVTPQGAATTLHGRTIDENGAVIDDFTHVVE